MATCISCGNPRCCSEVAVTSTLGDNPRVEFVDRIVSEQDRHIETLRKAGDEMHNMIRHMDFSEWEETHNPEVDKYAMRESLKEILDRWEGAKNGG